MKITGKKASALLLSFILALSMTNVIVLFGAIRFTKAVAAADPQTGREIVKTKEDLEWKTSIFGESISASTNVLVSGDHLDPDGVKLKADSDKFNAGKFTTSGYDGITFYNTQIDANKYDFYLQATVHVDEHGAFDPISGQRIPQGQEGFGLHIRDSLGVNGDVKKGMYSNSFSAMSTKITYKNALGANVDIYGGIGARYVEGVTDGDNPPTPISTGGKFQTYYKEFDRDEVAYSGKEYTFSIQKTNNSYTATWYKNELSTISYSMYAWRDTNTDKLLDVDNQYVYAGFAVARACIATFKDITLNLYDRSTETVVIPPEIITSSQAITSRTATSSSNYEFEYLSNQPGKLNILVDDNVVKSDITIEADKDYSTVIQLPKKLNTIKAVMTPTQDWEPGEGQRMSSYSVSTSTKTVEVDKYGKEGETIIVSPEGTDNGHGTAEKPLSLKRAVSFIQPGQTVLMRAGTYNITGGIEIQRGNDGSEGKFKRLIADPNATSRPIINFSTNNGFVLKGSYWHLKGFDVTNTQEKEKGVTVWGNNNVVERLDIYKNGNTGLQISGASTDHPDKWPKNNLILNVTSYWNHDPNFADADGFAAKLTCGPGNVFRGCIAYENADDGFDFYAKPENGPIGVVKIYNSVAYRNGKVPLPGLENMEGNGNGFKMGGASMPGAHEIYNSIAFENYSKGIDSNSGPDIKVYNTTSVDNVGYNYALYTSAANSAYVIDGSISFRTSNGTNEQFKLAGTQTMVTDERFTNPVDQYIKSLRNYFWENNKCVNRNGAELKADIFVSTTYTGDYPPITRDADGSINMNGYLELKSTFVTTVGARLTPTPGEQFDLGKIVDEKVEEADTGDNTDGNKNTGCGGTLSGINGSGSLMLTVILICAFAVVVMKRFKKPRAKLF